VPERFTADASIKVRLIPRLDIKGPNLVKGVHFEGLRVLGRPEEFARRYSEDGADELIYMDVVASLYGRNSLTEIIERTAREIFIPLTVGGGLRTVDDIRRVLRAGADKVALNTGALARPDLVLEGSRMFGSSTIVVSIEATRRADGTYEAYADYGRQSTGVDAVEWAKRAADLGAGELLVTSIDRDGTGRGFDLDLTRRIATAVSIPVVAAGGAGRVQHVSDVVVEGRADAVCVASLLHYHYVTELGFDERDFRGEGNVEHLRRGARPPNIDAVPIAPLKEHLAVSGVGCRPVHGVDRERAIRA
jgi:cyclase